MQIIPIAETPNQSFSVRLDGSRYEIAIKEARGRMVMDLVRDDVTLFRGMTLKTGTPVIPYRHLELGNFVFTSDDGSDPFYTEFNVTQQLVYLTIAEVEEARRNG